jgi:hypothetical protein
MSKPNPVSTYQQDERAIKAIGFTGTREGMTRQQTDYLTLLLAELFAKGAVDFHHGDCQGADSEAHHIARAAGFRTIAHPPLATHLRAWCRANVIRSPKNFHARNRDIVDDTDILLAAPNSEQEALRSGTWSTVRYARRKSKVTRIISP